MSGHSVRADWRRLEALLARPRRGRRRLDATEITELATLYRQAAASLAAAQATDADSKVAEYLEDLVLRAHGRVYAPEPAALSGIRHFLRERFPALVAAHHRLVLLATALFIAGALIGFVAVRWDPNLADALVPTRFRNAPTRGLSGELSSVGSSAFLSTQIMTNNIQVGVLAFGLGLSFGVGTVYVLMTNGVMLGALAATYYAQGLSIPFWATILPHGVIELTAIMLSAAAGLVLSRALIAPGDLTRRQALAGAGPKALGLALGTLPMYAVAAAIEGFVTPRGIPHWSKLLIAALTAIALVPYLRRGRRTATIGPAA